MAITPTSFLRFYGREIWTAPSKAMRAIIVIEHVLAISLFVIWLVNKRVADEAWAWLGDRSVWWFVGAIAIVFVHAFLVSNHAAFNRLETQLIDTEHRRDGAHFAQEILHAVSNHLPRGRELRELLDHQEDHFLRDWHHQKEWWENEISHWIWSTHKSLHAVDPEIAYEFWRLKPKQSRRIDFGHLPEQLLSVARAYVMRLEDIRNRMTRALGN